ncbi:MAG: pirin family protein [Pseudomonadota bacterium]
MSACPIENIIQAQPLAEGAGVVVHRTIGTPRLRNFDPFLMLDHFGSDNPNEYIAGFPNHPHRGFITLTYMLDGHMLHEDSMGNRGDLRAGGAQWMKAASGVIHSEMPQQTDGLMRGFQLWINLPANQKMSPPAYQEFSAEAFPVAPYGDASVKVLCGELHAHDKSNKIVGPITDPNTDIFYFDVAIKSSGAVDIPVPTGHRCFVYCYDGHASLVSEEGEHVIPQHCLVALGFGKKICIRSSNVDAKLIVVGGQPIGEDIVQYGPFVMNSRDEIERAITDFQAGRLVQEKAGFTTNTT